MVKLLAIIVLGLFLTNNLYAEELKVKRTFKMTDEELLKYHEEILKEKKEFVENNNWNWKKIYSKKGNNLITSKGAPIYAGTTYIDEDSISEMIWRKKSTRSFYNIINLENPIGSSLSIIFDTSVDCEKKKSINNYMQFFNEPFGKGKSAMQKKWEDGASPNQEWKKGTRMYSLGEHACKVKPNKTIDVDKLTIK